MDETIKAFESGNPSTADFEAAGLPFEAFLAFGQASEKVRNLFCAGVAAQLRERAGISEGSCGEEGTTRPLTSDADSGKASRQAEPDGKRDKAEPVEAPQDSSEVPEAQRICPWCGCNVQPVATAENLDRAEFVYSTPQNDPRVVARNPLMCPDCCGVGGFEDFEVA